eukprot:9159939-Prorocentrum_lima.AAC.1
MCHTQQVHRWRNQPIVNAPPKAHRHPFTPEASTLTTLKADKTRRILLGTFRRWSQAGTTSCIITRVASLKTRQQPMGIIFGLMEKAKPHCACMTWKGYTARYSK